LAGVAEKTGLLVDTPVIIGLDDFVKYYPIDQSGLGLLFKLREK
jgi:hypothetical protein